MYKHEGDYYCDEFIANINSTKIITSLWCKSNKIWLTKEELERKQSIGQKSLNDIQQTSNMPAVEVSQGYTREEDKKPVYEMKDFIRSIMSKGTDHVKEILGKESYYTKKFNQIQSYVWDWESEKDAPVKIIDPKHTKYYVNKIEIRVFGKYVTGIIGYYSNMMWFSPDFSPSE